MLKMKKILSLGMAIALGASVLVGCGGSDDNSKSTTKSDVIKLGAMAPQTGDVAVYGKSALNGYNLAIKEYNDGEKVLGKTVELVTYDDKGDDNEAVNAYNRLVDSDKVDAIIGGGNQHKHISYSTSCSS